MVAHVRSTVATAGTILQTGGPVSRAINESRGYLEGALISEY